MAFLHAQKVLGCLGDIKIYIILPNSERIIRMILSFHLTQPDPQLPIPLCRRTPKPFSDPPASRARQISRISSSISGRSLGPKLRRYALRWSLHRRCTIQQRSRRHLETMFESAPYTVTAHEEKKLARKTHHSHFDKTSQMFPGVKDSITVSIHQLWARGSPSS